MGMAATVEIKGRHEEFCTQHCGAVVLLEEANASSSVRRLIELIFCITIIYNMLLDLMFMKLKLYSAHPIMFSYSHGGFYEKEY